MIGRPPTCSTIGGLEAQLAQIKRLDKGIDDSYRVVFVDLVFQSIREQKPLRTINSIHESLHAKHPSTGAQILPAEAGFSHSLGRRLTYWPIVRTSFMIGRHPPLRQCRYRAF